MRNRLRTSNRARQRFRDRESELLRGEDELIESRDCYSKPQSTSLKVGGQEVGISGLRDIIERGLEHLEADDDEQKRVLLGELKARNYVPGSVEDEYMVSLWVEYRKARELRLEQLESSFKGIPREEIPWFPKVDQSRCSGCSSCVEFCIHDVFHFDGKSHVVKPFNCVVGNTSCRSFCPEKAISFPTHAQLKETLKNLKKRYGVED